MVAIERRISRMSHPDLPVDTAAFKHDSTSPRTSWRPSWLARSSTSRHSHTSSLSTSLSTTRSASVSTRRTISDMQNVYQLPSSHLDQAKAVELVGRPGSPSLHDMRYEFMDETFDFPLPAAIQNQPPTEPVISDGQQEYALPRAAKHDKSASVCCSSMCRFDASSIAASSSLASETSNRPTTSMSMHRKARDLKSDQETEIEMGSKEQFGYWNASFVARIPATAALCGTVLLTAKMPHRPAAESVTSSRCSASHAATATAEFAAELYSATTPHEVMRSVRRRGLASAALMLKASLDAAQVPGIPLKHAMAMFKKARHVPNKDHHKLWPHVLKQLKKMPQDRLVLVMFLVSVARKLQRRNVTIDGQEPGVYLLHGLWPSSLAINDDPVVANNLSRLLVSHFDAFPADFPTTLQAVNYRFASGKRYNMLGLMTDRHDHTGPGGVREIDGTDDTR